MGKARPARSSVPLASGGVFATGASPARLHFVHHIGILQCWHVTDGYIETDLKLVCVPSSRVIWLSDTTAGTVSVKAGLHDPSEHQRCAFGKATTVHAQPMTLGEY